MTGGWELPTRCTANGRSYAVHSDFRDVLEILRWLDGAADPDLTPEERWFVAMRLFYPDFAAMPRQDWGAASEFLRRFLAGGRPEPARPGPRLMDWQQDAAMIAAGVGRVTGRDPRALPYLHWWSFLGGFDAIGEGLFATVVGIRSKLCRGKRLEGWELEFYRAHRELVDLRRAPDPAAEAEKAKLLALLAE